MTITQLKYVVKVADAKSMNKAASELFVSQPALSGAIKDLEQELQFEIFMRNSRGIVLTARGEEFLSYARQMTEIMALAEERFLGSGVKKRFGVSMQHYTFAVEAFIKLGNSFAMDEYELAIHETRTAQVIDDVKNRKSEVGILYMNSFNSKVLSKILREADLEFVPLFDCGVWVYMASSHKLANKQVINFEDLEAYPCLSFEQGDKNSFYFAEEVLSTRNYRQTIKVDDRATMLNLMTGLMGYTLCTGIICESLNGDGFVSVPLNSNEVMTIGYIKRRNMPLSLIGEEYVNILKGYKSK